MKASMPKMARYYVLVLGGWMDGWRQCWSLDQKLGVAAAAKWHESSGRKEEMERTEPDGLRLVGARIRTGGSVGREIRSDQGFPFHIWRWTSRVQQVQQDETEITRGSHVRGSLSLKEKRGWTAGSGRPICVGCTNTRCHACPHQTNALLTSARFRLSIIFIISLIHIDGPRTTDPLSLVASYFVLPRCLHFAFYLACFFVFFFPLR